MRLYVLCMGYMELDQAWLVLNYDTATINEPNKPAVWGRVPILSFLIMHKDANILFDTGCDPRGMTEHWPDYTRRHFPCYEIEERLENKLSALGLKIDDINYVVASHLHYDHAGNVNIFKKAKILVNSVEFSHALQATHIEQPYRTAYSKYDINVEGIHWQPVTEDFELVPGVEVINLEGHSPGVLGLVIHLEKAGTVICPSDALYSPINYGPPPRLPGSLYDSLGFFRSVEKIRRLEKKYKAMILYSHNLKQYNEEMLKLPEFYC